MNYQGGVSSFSYISYHMYPSSDSGFPIWSQLLRCQLVLLHGEKSRLPKKTTSDISGEHSDSISLDMTHIL